MMNKTNQSLRVKAWSVPGRQTGMVLIMALLMLMVLTIIGVSSMSSSTLEMKVASNMQQRNIAFQAAQARLAFAASLGVSQGTSTIDYLINIPDLTDPSTWPVQPCNDPDCPNGDDWTATANVSYSGCGKGAGNSLEAGKGFSYRTFEIKATGETLTGSSRSVQVSAILYPVKACGNETI